MTFTLNTQEKRQRVIDGKNEAERKLAKEMQYPEDLRDNDQVERYQSHIARMNAALEAGVLETTF